MLPGKPSPSQDSQPTARAASRRLPLRVFSIAALPALLLHGALLSGLPAIEVPSARPAVPAPVRVRAVEAVRPGLAAARQIEAVDNTGVPALAVPVSRPPKLKTSISPAAETLSSETDDRPTSVPAAPSLAIPAELSTAEVVAETEFVAEVAAVTGQSEGSSASVEDELSETLARNEPKKTTANRQVGAAEVDGFAVPTYSTAPAAPQVLRYNLQRGLLSGTAELSWRHDPVNQPAARYELQLLAKVGGIPIMTQISIGEFDKAGLAPVRLTDQRLRGSVRAANFQRQRGVISFSGPSVEYALVGGAQDRLSWMLQLPAILAANPHFAKPGQQVTLYVVGARGDASVWVFRFDAVERITTDGGAINAVKFVREPRKDHDTLAEVWLDPSREFVPVRARIGNPDDGPMLELLRMQG